MQLEFWQICTTNERVWPEFLQICTECGQSSYTDSVQQMTEYGQSSCKSVQQMRECSWSSCKSVQSVAGVPANLYRVWPEFLQICTTNERVWPEFLQICTTTERVQPEFWQICTTNERVWLEFLLLISDVVHLSWTYLILSIKIRLYLCRLDYILSMFLLYLPFWISLLSSFRTSYCFFLFCTFFCSKNNRQSRLSF